MYTYKIHALLALLRLLASLDPGTVVQTFRIYFSFPALHADAGYKNDILREVLSCWEGI